MDRFANTTEHFAKGLNVFNESEPLVSPVSKFVTERTVVTGGHFFIDITKGVFGTANGFGEGVPLLTASLNLAGVEFTGEFTKGALEFVGCGFVKVGECFAHSLGTGFGALEFLFEFVDFTGIDRKRLGVATV